MNSICLLEPRLAHQRQSEQSRVHVCATAASSPEATWRATDGRILMSSTEVALSVVFLHVQHRSTQPAAVLRAKPHPLGAVPYSSGGSRAKTQGRPLRRAAFQSGELLDGRLRSLGLCRKRGSSQGQESEDSSPKRSPAGDVGDDDRREVQEDEDGAAVEGI